MKLFWGLSFIFCISNSLALVRTKTQTGLDISWGSTSVIPIDIVTNSKTFNETQIQTIINESIQEWNNESNTQVVPSYVSSSSADTRLEFISSSNASFGSGVVAVTSVNFSNLNGKIRSAKISINEYDYNFTSNKSTNPQLAPYDIYLGDAVTHELGHLLGLGHSEVVGSTMNYSSAMNQYDLHEDDKSSIRAMYPSSTQASIYGRIIGGSNITPIFGAYVSLISSKTGGVVASAISNPDGGFLIEGLSQQDDNYYIYVEPLKNKSALPDYYSSVQSNFCPGDYVGSFYTTCSSASKGFPQTISLLSSDSQLNVGDISIQCDLSVNTDYLATKSVGSNSQYEIIDSSSRLEEDGGMSFLGFFYDSQVDSSSNNSSDWDELTIDLTSEASPSSKALKINVLSLSFGVPVEYTIHLQDNSSTAITSEVKDEIGIIQALDSNQANNIYKLVVKPRALTSNTELKATFPTPSVFTTDSYFYLVTVDVVDASNTSDLLSVVSNHIEDNYMCSQAPFAYGVEAVVSDIENNEDVDVLGTSCGTISGPNDSGSGGSFFSLILGIALTIIVSQLGRSRKIV